MRPKTLISPSSSLYPKSFSVTAGREENRTPLCERPARFVLPLSTFKEWKERQFKELENKAAISGIPASELKGIRERTTADWIPLSLGMHQLDLASTRGDCLMRLTLTELDALWSQRFSDRKPIQYLTRSVHWRDFILAVGPGVLIPRPETEQTIDLIETTLKRNPDLSKCPWADLGTGSGAIAIGLAGLLLRYDSRSIVLAIDASKICIDCIEHNLKRLEVKNVRPLMGDWFEPLKTWNGQLAGIVCNPPYIPSEDVNGLQPEVARHEPREALDGGIDGLTDIKILIRRAPEYLAPGGVLLLETHGPSQIGSVKRLLEGDGNAIFGDGFDEVEVHRDVFGVERFVTAIRTGKRGDDPPERN